MSQDVNDRRAGPWTLNAAQTGPHSFDFTIRASSELRVTRIRDGVESVLALTDGYTVSVSTYPGIGTITLVDDPEEDDVLIIDGVRSFASVASDENSERLDADRLNIKFDTMTRDQQELRRDQADALRAQRGEGPVVFPPRADWENKIAVPLAGDDWLLVPTTDVSALADRVDEIDALSTPARLAALDTVYADLDGSDTIGAAATLVNAGSPGFVAITGAGAAAVRTVEAGSGLAVTNPTGASGNLGISFAEALLNGVSGQAFGPDGYGGVTLMTPYGSGNVLLDASDQVFTGSGNTFFEHVAWHNTPERHGAVGDGTTDDTDAVFRWMASGGGACYDGSKTYLIDPMIITTAVQIWCVPGVTFKQRGSFDAVRRGAAVEVVDVAADTIEITSHGFANDDVVVYSNIEGVGITGLTDGASYYAVNATDDTLQLSETQGGAAIALSGSLFGSNMLHEVQNRWTNPAGTFEFRRDVSAKLLQIDCNRDSAAVTTGLSALRGTDENDIDINEYKSGVYLRASSPMKVHIDKIRVENSMNYGLTAFATSTGSLSGHIDRMHADQCGCLARFDNTEDLILGDFAAETLDNRIGQDNDEWFPSYFHGFQLSGCRSTPVRSVRINKVIGRPGEWLDGSTTPFMNGVTRSACIDCPINHIEILYMQPSMETAADTSGSVASETGALGFSDPGNLRSTVGYCYVAGALSQGWECVPLDDISYGQFVLMGNHGRQARGNGSVGIMSHGGQRVQEDIAESRMKRRPRIYVESVTVSGFHYGALLRKNRNEYGTFHAFNNRADGLVLDNLNESEWVAEADPQLPSVVIHNADIRFNGRHGIRIVSADEMIARGGRISDNCQMSGYDDPTLSGSAFTASAGIFYDNSESHSQEPRVLVVSGVITDACDTFDRASGVSYIPATPAAGTVDTIPDDRIDTILVAFREPNEVYKGQRITFKDVDSADSQDVDGWIRAFYGDLALIEVDTATFSGAWAENSKTVALTNAFDIADGSNEMLSTSNNGDLENDIEGPCAVKADTAGEWVFLQTVMDADDARIYTESEAGDDLVNQLTGAISADTFSRLDTGLSYTNAQTTDFSFDDVTAGVPRICRPYAEDETATFGGLNVTNGFINLSVTGGGAKSETIAAGVITVEHTWTKVNTESNAATDDLETINGGTNGDILILGPVSSSRTVVVKHKSGGADNIKLKNDQDFEMDHSACSLLLRYDDPNWIEVSRSNADGTFVTVADMTDSTGGTAGGTLSAVGDTSAADQSGTINDNFASVSADLNAIKAALRTGAVIAGS